MKVPSGKHKAAHVTLLRAQLTLDHVIRQCQTWQTTCNMQDHSQPQTQTKET